MTAASRFFIYALEILSLMSAEIINLCQFNAKLKEN